ncbi:RNA-binding protein NOB1 isoform X3 [Pteropus medius]|uniref:RNA-binding protein NOB1 n=1 Tax=Pteropus vampyrus TaxID=132908 RepID=A0A6P6BZ49_PTEVA|nr:RNA-binding protein NOB1 isoform X3 [Pteropus vampyrus]XP_039707798.1 RNA-binding protein NOB1 isoform X3 [Pteropus giganteus]
MALVEHVVADAGAFLRDAALQDIGKNIYTIRDVVSEIRDKATRRRLAVLPYELRFKEPFPEYVRLDIQVLALTYQLEAEFVGVSHLKQEPEKVKVSSSIQHPETPLHISGFHLPSKPKLPRETVEHGHPADEPEDLEFSSFMFWRNPLPNIDYDLQELMTGRGENVPSEEDKEENRFEERKDEGSDDDGGWITPSNIKQIQRELEQCTIPKDVRVGCVTTDFAMQNVLLQMGLHVLAVNGMLIREARSYILRCHGCFKTTSDMSRVFCSHCGNKTLKKVSVTVSDDGSLHMHFSRNPKVLNPRGLRYSLPSPKGGKYAINPHLTEDQRFPQLRLSRKARQKTDVFAPDYVAGVSPFAENDISSRSATLQIRDNTLGAGRRRLNPNASRKKFVKKR